MNTELNTSVELAINIIVQHTDCVREVQMDNVEWTSKTLPVFREYSERNRGEVRIFRDLIDSEIWRCPNSSNIHLYC